MQRFSPIEQIATIHEMQVMSEKLHRTSPEPALHPFTGASAVDSDRLFRRRLILVGMIASAFLAAWLAVWVASDVLLLIFAGALLAIFLRGLTEMVARYVGLRDGAALTVVLLGIGALVTILGLYLAPKVSEQIEQLAVDLPNAMQSLHERVESTPAGKYLLREVEVERMMRRPQVVAGATGFATATVGLVFSAMIVLFIGVYAAYDPRLYVRGAEHLVPHPHRARYQQLTSDMYATLWWWLIGRLCECVFVGVLTTVGLWILGVPLALTLGIIAGVLNFVPNFGPLIAFVPAGMIAATQGMEQLAWTALLYLVVQSLENYVLAPIVQLRLVKLAPVLVLGSQILFWLLFGFLGLFLATPIAAALLVMVKVLYVRPVIGDRVDD